MANQKLKQFARKAGIPQWLIAQALDVSEPTFTRMLRNELSEEKKAEIVSVIKALKSERDTSFELECEIDAKSV